MTENSKSICHERAPPQGANMVSIVSLALVSVGSLALTSNVVLRDMIALAIERRETVGPEALVKF